MSTVLEKFAKERGVLAPPPDRPLATYDKYWERTVRWLAAAAQAPAIVQDHGAQALHILNQAIGVPVFFTDGRYVPQLKRQGEYGFILLPGGCEWALKKDVGDHRRKSPGVESATWKTDLLSPFLSRHK